MLIELRDSWLLTKTILVENLPLPQLSKALEFLGNQN